MHHHLSATLTNTTLLTCEQMGRADAWAMAHVMAGAALMQEAGQQVAQAMLARWAPRRVLVCCGPGNNGGDGHVVARLLHQAGWTVTWASLQPRSALTGDALHHAELTAQWLPMQALSVEHVTDQDLLVDALFGAGLVRPVSGVAAEVLTQAHEQRLPIVAIDVPSGLHGDTGAVWGAVPAALTVTFFRKKPAHVLMPGRALCGELCVRDIGIPSQALQHVSQAPLSMWENTPALWLSHWPHPASHRTGTSQARHKYQRGHVLVWGGAVMIGAARLSARAAARVGAGLTTLLVPERVWPIYAAGLQCGMAQTLPDDSAHALVAAWDTHLQNTNGHALVLGPGATLGLPGDAPQATLRDMALSALARTQDRAVVLDADALTAFESQPQDLFSAITAQASAAVVLTPHEGEFRRLFTALLPEADSSPLTGQAMDKVSVTREAARRSGAVVLHKGPDTVVAAPDGRVAINTLAPPDLATAGSGDVLSGLIAGLLAQGVPAFEAACAGAWLHGAAAHVHGPGLLADDLPECLPEVMRQLWPT